MLRRMAAKTVTNPAISRNGSQYLFLKKVLIGSTYPQVLEKIFINIRITKSPTPSKNPDAILRGVGCPLAMIPEKMPKSMNTTGNNMIMNTKGICWYQVGEETTTAGDPGSAGNWIVWIRIVPTRDMENKMFHNVIRLGLMLPTHPGL